MVLNVGIGVVFSAILTLSLIPYDYDASAQSCKRIPLEEEYEKTDLIFLGKAIQKEYSESSFEPPITTFEIEKVYKGDPLNEAKVASLEMIFDIEFEVGKKYLVFAEPTDSYFLAGPCSPTSLVSESTMKIIDQVILLSEQESILELEEGMDEARKLVRQHQQMRFLQEVILPIILIAAASIITVFVIKRRKS